MERREFLKIVAGIAAGAAALAATAQAAPLMPHPLNEDAMVDAARFVAGTHDFTSFAAVDPERGRDDEEPDNVRTIYSSEWRRDGDLFIAARTDAAGVEGIDAAIARSRLFMEEPAVSSAGTSGRPPVSSVAIMREKTAT